MIGTAANDTTVAFCTLKLRSGTDHLTGGLRLRPDLSKNPAISLHTSLPPDSPFQCTRIYPTSRKHWSIGRM